MFEGPPHPVFIHHVDQRYPPDLIDKLQSALISMESDDDRITAYFFFPVDGQPANSEIKRGVRVTTGIQHNVGRGVDVAKVRDGGIVWDPFVGDGDTLTQTIRACTLGDPLSKNQQDESMKPRKLR